MEQDKQTWPLWEIFIRSASGLEHKHVGSLMAVDSRMALENARDVYTRRKEGISIWAVKSADIAASDPADKIGDFESGNDKIYRHPSFYKVPEGVEHI